MKGGMKPINVKYNNKTDDEPKLNNRHANSSGKTSERPAFGQTRDLRGRRIKDKK